MKIGHGPATVIGCAWREPKVRNLPELVEADTLRERGCGDKPRSIREAFLLEKTLRTRAEKSFALFLRWHAAMRFARRLRSRVKRLATSAR